MKILTVEGCEECPFGNAYFKSVKQEGLKTWADCKKINEEGWAEDLYKQCPLPNYTNRR